jgi:hypothetical protein
LDRPTYAGTPIETIGENLNSSNLQNGAESENPGALAGATGAKDLCIGDTAKQYRNKRARAMALREAIRECDPTDAAVILSDALDKMRLGAPIPALINAMDEAQSWAEWATPAEHKAYCLACYNAMPPKDRAGFLAYVTGRAAA